MFFTKSKISKWFLQKAKIENAFYKKQNIKMLF